MVGSRTPMEWLGGERREDVLKLSKQHMEYVLKTAEKMMETIHLFCEAADEEKISQSSEETIKKERQTDEIKGEILDELSEGVFHPINREGIIRLVMTADDIADNARGAAAKATFLDPSDVGEDVRDELKMLSGFAFEIVQMLEDTYSTLLKDLEEVLKKTDEVEKMEEKIDYFRAKNLRPKIIEWADDAHRPGTSSILLEVEDNIEEVADQSENVADIIREIAIQSA